MNKQKVRELLVHYGLQFEQDVEQAMKCSNSAQKWSEYIKTWIGESSQEQFRMKLYEMNILQNESIDLQAVESIHNQFFEEILENEIKINNIYVSAIEQYRWSQKLMQQIRKQTKRNIETNLVLSNTINQFLQQQICFILDILFRKANLNQYFEQIKIAINIFNQKHPLFRIFKEMTFEDFIICLVRFSNNQGVIGKLLNELGIPIPIIYSLHQKPVFNLELILDVLGTQSYSLILNIGTPKTSKCGKTSLIAKMLSLKQEFISGNHLQYTVNLYTKFNFSERGRFALMDVNGEFSDKSNQQLLKIIQDYANSVSLLIIHATQGQIKSGIFKEKSYANLLQYAEKVIIYVRDKPFSSQKVLQRFIPKQLKQKCMIVCLDNFRQKISNTQYKQQILKIVQKSFNVFNEAKFSYLKICMNSLKQDFQHYEQKVDNIMKLIEDKGYNKNLATPNISKIQQLSQLEEKIKQQNKSEVRISQYKQRQKILNNQLKNSKLSKFVQKSIQIIQINPICKQILAQRLQDWKNANNKPLRQQFLELSNLLYEKKGDPDELKRKIHENQQQRSHYQVTVDKIINQLVVYNQVAKDQKYTQIVTNFYRQSLKQISPINLIDGKTLTFGNNTIKDIISTISDQYSRQKKKVYIVSVIGAQSSAKSTLLNFLFRCKFQTSAGRCTKGIYMNLIEIDDLVLVVLDTQGLLSVSARDTAFDHQIASFILKISNLIIINNKGELTSTLQQMLQVCLYVLQCLHKDEKQVQYNPQKIIFALRDQATSSQLIQKEQAAKIKNSLQEIKTTSSFDYNNFFNIQTNDIFSLPSALIESRGLIPKVGSTKAYDPTFGQCIFGMRNRIVAYLKSIPSEKTLKQFYQQASRAWQTIQNCGKDIMNFKTFNQITIKKSIQQKYNQKADTYKNQMQVKYEQFFKMIKDVTKSQQLQCSDYKLRIKQIKGINLNTITEDFNNQCKQICSNKQWVKQFYPKIQRICICYETSYFQQFERIIARMKQKERDEQLAKKLNKIISSLLSQNIPKEEIISKFQADVNNIKQEILKQRKINKDKLSLQIMQIFQNILSLGKYAELKIYHIEDCYRIYATLLNQSNISKKISQLFRFHHEFLRSSQDEYLLDNIFKMLLKQFQKKVKESMIIAKITQPFDIYDKNKVFLQEINNSIFHCCQILMTINHHNWVMKVFIYEPIFKIVLFGKLYDTIKNQIYELKLSNNNKEINKISNKMRQYQQNLIRILKVSGNAKEIIDNDINTFMKQLKESSVKQCKQLIEDSIGKLSLRLTPQSIFSKAMNQTLLDTNSTNNKYYYIQCYKMVKNINRYLYEIMCQSQQISTRSNTIIYAIQNATKHAEKKLYQLKYNLQQIAKSSKDEQIKQFLNSINMIGSSNIQNENISIRQILNNLLKSIEENYVNFISEIKTLLKNSNFDEYSLKFIQGQLKDKVIGCQSLCPSCRMKCMLPKGHSQNHKVLQNCHSLSAFGGCWSQPNKEPWLKICQKKENVCHVWHHNMEHLANLKQLISKYYPEWQNDFPDIHEEHRFQKFTDEARLHKIWANIENVLLSTKHTHVIRSTSLEIKQLRDKDQLTLDDLNAEYQEILTKKKYKLKDY